MKKFLLSIIMALLCVCSASAYDLAYNGLYYNITSRADKTVEVKGWYMNIDPISVPEKVTINNIKYSVTSIGEDAFKYCSSLSSITIPNGVTSIGMFAFQNCI